MSRRTTRSFEKRDDIAEQTRIAFPPDVAEYTVHCKYCMRGPITIAHIGHALTCPNSEENNGDA